MSAGGTERGVVVESDEEEDTEAKDGTSLQESDRFCLSLHDRFGDGRDSFLAKDGIESFIFVGSLASGGDVWRWEMAKKSRERWMQARLQPAGAHMARRMGFWVSTERRASTNHWDLEAAVGDEMSGRCANAKEVPERVITDPEVANLIKFVAVLFAIGTIGIYIYCVSIIFTIDGPWWQPYALSAAALPFTIIPLAVVPTITDAFISEFAEAPRNNNGNRDLTSNLVGSEDV